jgi:hypothetical protein
VPRPSDDEHYWFKAKVYGWGWTPCSRQGWAALGVWAFVFAVALVGGALSGKSALFATGILIAASSTLVFAWVAWRHGEPARWSWGRR